MATDTEYERIVAKQLFTRVKWALLDSITEDEGVGIVESRFQDLKSKWIMVQYKNDLYLSKLLDENGTNTSEYEQWIDDLEMEFMHVKREKVKYIHKAHLEHGKILAPRNNTVVRYCNSASKQFQQNTEKSEKKILDKLKNLRGCEEYNFICTVERLCDLITTDDIGFNMDCLRKAHQEMKKQYSVWKTAQNNYVSLLSLEEANLEFDWMKVIQKLYLHTNRRVSEIYQAEKEGLLSPYSYSRTDGDFIWLDRNRLPTFKGDLREYPRFKAAFKKHVLPVMNYNCSAGFVLKCCLKGEPRELVMDLDDIEEMWRVLDEKYGLWDYVIDDMRSFHHAAEDIANSSQSAICNENGYGKLKQINKLRVRYPLQY